MKIIKRRITDLILKRLNYRKIIGIIGARQTGKTTLCKKIIPSIINQKVEYFLFDDLDERIRFKNDGIKILQTLKSNLIILDEIQKIPDIFEQIKYVSEKNNHLKFIITGSSNILLLKNIKETLAGRISLFNLHPFSLNEIIEKKNNILTEIVISMNPEIIFDIFINLHSDDKRQLQIFAEQLLKFGGFPPVWDIDDEEEKIFWLKDYRKTFIERDLKDIAGLINLDNFIIVQKLLAIRNSQILNISEIAKEAKVSVNTVKNYINVLKIGFQCLTLPPYFENIKKRIIKSPKLYFIDNGLVKVIAGKDTLSSGALFEAFIFSELYKWKDSISGDVELFYC